MSESIDTLLSEVFARARLHHASLSIEYYASSPELYSASISRGDSLVSITDLVFSDLLSTVQRVLRGFEQEVEP